VVIDERRRYSWERQPRESAKAYEGARLFFELGPGRTLQLVADRLKKQLSLMKRWSARWRWMERAREYDNQWATAVDDATRRSSDAFLADILKWQERQMEQREQLYNQGQMCLRIAERMIAWPIQKQTRQEALEDGQPATIIIEPAKWSTQSAVALMSLGVELSGLAIGIQLGSDPLVDYLKGNGKSLPREVLEEIAAGRPVVLTALDKKG
jgi:hypothetical protein